MTDSSMLKYQYDTILDQLILLQLHAESPDCPCSLQGTRPGELGEFCEPKHLRSIVALARETIAMEEDRARLDYLENLVLEGSELLGKMEDKLCDKEVDLGDYITWSREKRKPLEEFCYSGFCAIPKEEATVEEVARMFRKKVEPRWCYPVKETDQELGKLSRTLGTAKKRIAEIKRHLEMPLNICRGQAEMFESTTGVLDPYGSRCRDPKSGQWVYSEECGYEPAGITTTALGMDGITRYEFEFKIVSADKLIISHNPFTFTPNPDYPAELQPRLRERAATKIQVEKIAANLEPDAVITDFHVIDRGTPIVGQDLVVEAGNGRVMGIIMAVANHPEKYSNYKQVLSERARDYGLSPKDVDAIKNPVLVRVRITDVDRTTFAQEANQAATIAPSAIENARTDAQKITLGMLQELAVGENESLEDALRAPKNQPFALRFLATLPENVQAALVDAQGYLNRDGVHRMAMAVFVSAFQGDSGLRLAEKAFESIDMDVRNTVNAIARSLGPMAQAEALTRTGERDSALSIGDDLAQTVNVYSAIKRNPALTVEKYLAQEQIFARELTPFQESILVVLEEYKRAPKKLAGIFTAYAEGVISAPPPAQVALIPGAEITKEGLWESAVKAPEPQPALMEVARMFGESCELPSAKYQHLSAFFTETATETALFAAEPGGKERKIDTVLAQLQSGIEAIHESSKFKEFIDTMAKFHNYSLGNIMLITLQKPAATNVAGYTTWQGLGRNVISGEHGIMILAPCFPPKPKKEEEEEGEEEIEPERKPIYFKVVHVFDIAQTHGKELPKVEVPVITGDETRHLYQKAETYVAKLGITLDSRPRPDLRPDLMGYWAPPPESLIWVRPEAPQDQRTKTLLHETAHAKCEMRGARDAEVMAESVAYTVANHFGFDTGVRSFPYVALWARDVKVLKRNLETIRVVAKDMIDGLELVAGLSADTKEVIRMSETIEHKMGVLDFQGLVNRMGHRLCIYAGGYELADDPAVKAKYSVLADELHSLLIDTKILPTEPSVEEVRECLRKMPQFVLFEEARMKQSKKRSIADVCKEIRYMLKEQPWGAGSMLSWAERLKVLADGAEGCESLQKAAYTKALEVIKIAQPMLKPAKVGQVAGMSETARIESIADDQVLPVMKEYPGDQLTSSEVKRLGKLKVSDNTIIRALDYLESAGEVISFPATPEKPKRWAALVFEEQLKAPMKLLTKEIRDKLPPLYSQEKVQDPMVWVKFFTPDSNWTWYATEFDGDDTFFGWVVGFEKELGIFSLSELESARGLMGLAIERDKWFTPMPLSEVKKLHAHEMGEMGDEKSSAGFPLNPREEKPEDMDRFYRWTEKASSGEILSEVCERADYLGAHLCLAKEGDDVDKEWLEKCPYIGTVDVYSELGRLRFLCWKLTDKLPSSVTILGKEAKLAQGTMGAIGAATITGIGIGAGFKLIDWVAKTFTKKESKEGELGDRRHYFCDWINHHPQREIVQILTDKEDPKCPYCGRIMTYGAFWGRSQMRAEVGELPVDLVVTKRNFADGVYYAYDHAIDRDRAIKRAEEYRAKGYKTKLTKDPGGGLLIWIDEASFLALFKASEEQKELQAVDEALKTAEEI